MEEAQALLESRQESTLHCGPFLMDGGLSLCATHPGVVEDVAPAEAALHPGRSGSEAHFSVSLPLRANPRVPEAPQPISALADPILLSVGNVLAVLDESRPRQLQDERTPHEPTGAFQVSISG